MTPPCAGFAVALPSAGLEPVAVLVVEDSRSVRIQLRKVLSELPALEIIEAGSLAEARCALDIEHRRFFCAVLDLTLPDASGSEIVDFVSAHGVPAIVLTATWDLHIREQVLQKRVIDYLIKSGYDSIQDVARLVSRLRQNQTTPVMVVDDSATYRLHMAELLGQYRFPVVCATNGREALALLEQHPDTVLVLTDFHMPEMDGLELVRALRRQHPREDLAIIALSDATRPDLSAAMLKAGANDYLSKRFQIEEFYCRVTQNVNMVNYVRQLRDMAHKDPLTGLHNRRFLFDAGAALHAGAQRGAFRIALAVIDIDHFKRVNDEFGHLVGDQALVQIANTTRKVMRATDIVVRFGGEEFVCLAVLHEDTDPRALFDRLRQALGEIELYAEGRRVLIAASIGVTTVLKGSLSEMIDCADQAVYTAKAGGRNQVVMYCDA